jgi:arylsulfatase
MDYRVGQILDAIDQAGISDNTIVVFSSDDAASNVPAHQGGSNGPWRGEFFTPGFEGSYRVAAMIRWPGKIKAGVVTNEILAATDWLPTLAARVGESKRIPTDRPIDGLDASPFLLGKSRTNARDYFMFFGQDGGLMSVKWKNYKVVLRYPNGISEPIVQPQVALFYDLSSDPGETNNLNETVMDNVWLLEPISKLIRDYQESVEEYPNIKTGEDFRGY